MKNPNRNTRGLLCAFFASLCLSWPAVSGARDYESRWDSLDKRPIPEWWQDAKFGIFVHWGIYSVPAFAPTGQAGRYDGYSEWYQGRMIGGNKTFADFHARHYGKRPYADFAAEFKAEHFNASEWADLFRRAGARYVVLTSKHHDGYALWPSPESPYYNSVAVGPGRDLAGEFTSAMKAVGLKSGFYYSLLEYANPLYPAKTDATASESALPIGDWACRVNLPQMKELVNNYGADIIWVDGEWDYSSSEHLAEQFLAWLYNESPVKDTVVVNDRWGKDCRGRHGGHYTTEYGSEAEKEAVGATMHPWEENRGIGRSFGYNQFETAEDYLSRKECIELLVSVVSRGGNLLLDVGPDRHGRIPPIMQDRLNAVGRWLKINGEAIYATRRGSLKCDRKRVYSTDGKMLKYVVDFNQDGKPLVVEGLESDVRVTLLGSDVQVKTSRENGRLTIIPPSLPMALAPCEFAWTYRIEEKRP